MADDVFTLEKLVELSPDALTRLRHCICSISWSAHGLPGTEELDTSGDFGYAG